jgi:hypothetical protein
MTRVLLLVLVFASWTGNVRGDDFLRPPVTVYGSQGPRFHYTGSPPSSARSPLAAVGSRGQGYHSGQLDYPCAVCPEWLGYHGPRRYCDNVTLPWAPGGFFGWRDTYEPELRYNPVPFDGSLTIPAADGSPQPVGHARSILPPRRSVSVPAPAPAS